MESLTVTRVRQHRDAGKHQGPRKAQRGKHQPAAEQRHREKGNRYPDRLRSAGSRYQACRGGTAGKPVNRFTVPRRTTPGKPEKYKKERLYYGHYHCWRR